jgi:two-component system, sensor histidine kinase
MRTDWRTVATEGEHGPASRNESGGTTRPKPLRLPRRGTYSILVVDDETDITRILKAGFELLGHSVVIASSGEEAVAVFDETRFDAVICDLGMPGMSGWEVGWRIKETCLSKGVPKTPFVVLTGLPEQHKELAKIEQSGVDALEQKPMDILKLLDILLRVCRKTRVEAASQ